MKRPYLITDSTAPAGDEQQHLRSHIMSLGRHFPLYMYGTDHDFSGNRGSGPF
jgi:hypothetical protein